MVVSSVLIVGDTQAACACAGVLARAGVDVAMIDTAAAEAAASDVVDHATDVGVHVRRALMLAGVVEIDDYIEAELSDGKVENFDLVVLAGGGSAREFSRRGSPRFVTLPADADPTAFAEHLIAVHSSE